MMSTPEYQKIRHRKIVVERFGGIEVLQPTDAVLPAPPPGGMPG